ncbi:type II secretion system F family protein [Candidatus Daviesbacteria bacterium]|nr:type II secretion system F family protein [Candidatus Daviesbacteria bacterium]
MLKSGIPIAEAIISLRDQTTNMAFKEVLAAVTADVENGQSLEKSLSKHPKVFNTLYLSLVSTGEKSGNLEENLDYLAQQLRKSYDFDKKIQGATLYPKIVLAATAIMGGTLSLFVLPQLVTLFASLDVKLPLSTKILLFFANTMKNFGVFIALGLVIAAIIASLVLKTPIIKPLWHRFLIRLPIFGKLIQNIELANICRNLGIMLKSGLTVTQSLDAQFEATQNLVFKDYLDHLRKAVEKGKKISDEMSVTKFKFIPAIVPKMVGVGEQTGKLEDVLIYLGDFFEEEADDATKNLSTTIEPILLLIVGTVVGFVALAIVTPIYDLTSGIKK